MHLIAPAKTDRLNTCLLTRPSPRLGYPMPQASSLSPRFLFILLGALAGLTPLAVDMYLPAIPAIARDLATSIDGAQLTISTPYTVLLRYIAAKAIDNRE